MSQTHAHCAIIKVKSAFWASHVPGVTLITAQLGSISRTMSTASGSGTSCQFSCVLRTIWDILEIYWKRICFGSRGLGNRHK